MKLDSLNIKIQWFTRNFGGQKHSYYKSFTEKLQFRALSCFPRNHHIEGFWLVFKSFCYDMSNFSKKNVGGGGNRKEPKIVTLIV